MTNILKKTKQVLILFLITSISLAQQNMQDVSNEASLLKTKISIVNESLVIDGRINQINLGFGTFFGNDAGLNDDLSDNINTAIGYNALKHNLSGSYNTTVGHRTLENNIGSYNTSLGSFALYHNIKGGYNTALGALSLRNNISGYSNTAIGQSTLNKNTIGALNTATGVGSQQFNIEGTGNTATGFQSLYNNKTGNSNASFGAFSLKSIESGTYNIALGYRSGKHLSDDLTDLTKSNKSVFLGAETKSLQNNSTNEIVIGYNTTGKGSNTVVLGNNHVTNTYLKGEVKAVKYTSENDISITQVSFNKIHTKGGNLSYALINNRLICVGRFKGGLNGKGVIAILPEGARPGRTRNICVFTEDGEPILVEICPTGEIVMSTKEETKYIIDFEITLNL